MKVALVADKLNVDRGGSNFSLDLIASALSNQGHKVTVLTVNFAHENKLPSEYPYQVLESQVNEGSRLRKAVQVYRTLRTYASEFDIYHIFNPALLPIAGWFNKTQSSVGVVGRLNTYDQFCTNLAKMDGHCHKHCTVSKKVRHSTGSPRDEFIQLPKYLFDTHGLPALLNSVDRLFAISPAVKDVFTGIGVNQDRMTIIPNFADPSFVSAADEARSFDFNQTVLYVGSIAPHKGVDLLLNASESLPTDVGVEIVGDGSLTPRLSRHVEEEGLDERVTIHGRVDHDDLAGYYLGADVFVHPGRWPEPFGRTVLEAMQCDCPAIVSDIGAPPWIVGDSGQTFERGSEADLVRVLNAFLSDSDLQTQYVERCRERRQTFKVDTSITQIEGEYWSVLQQHALA